MRDTPAEVFALQCCRCPAEDSHTTVVAVIGFASSAWTAAPAALSQQPRAPTSTVFVLRFVLRSRLRRTIIRGAPPSVSSEKALDCAWTGQCAKTRALAGGG